MQIPASIIAHRRRYYTQRELGRLIGASNHVVHRIEKGRTNVAVGYVHAYLKALGCSLQVRVAREVDADPGLHGEDRDPLYMARELMRLG